MKKLLLVFLLFFSFKTLAQSFQQVSIQGLVVDSASNQPLGFATVTLLKTKTNRSAGSVLTQDTGTFELYGTENEPYNIVITYMGYQSKTITIPEKTLKADIGKIRLTALTSQLKEVSVSAVKATLKQEIDRVSFDVQADPESKANDALEMLKKVPMITVDGNDKIQLKGSDSYRIFINGQPSSLMANDPGEVLKSIPAATIAKIEVITVPPSKYDSEGLAGIINIITIRKNYDGFNGSAFARYNNNVGERGSISLAAKKGKLELNTFFGLGYQKVVSLPAGSQLTTFATGSDLNQNGQNINRGNVNNGQTQLNYQIDSLNLLTASMDFADRNLTKNSMQFTAFSTPAGIMQSYNLDNQNYITDRSFNVDAAYQLGFKQKKGELITFSYQLLSASQHNRSGAFITDRFNYTNADYNQQNNADSRDHTFQVDYTNPFRALSIETGTKAILRNINSGYQEENKDPANGTYIPDPNFSNQFNYNQNVYSTYGTAQLKLKNLTLKGGLRAEYTAINGNSVANNSIAIDQHYVNIVPAISLQHAYPKAGTFTLGYTERVQRPAINELNPFVNRANPSAIITGNPVLSPVVNHVFELDYGIFSKLTISASLNYAFANNTIQNVTLLIDDKSSETTYLNTGKRKSGGLSISLGYPVIDGMNLTLNGQLNHIWLTGIYKNVSYATEGTQGNLMGTASYKLGNDYRISTNFFYNGANVYLQGKSSAYLSTTYVITKDFLNKKATLSLTVYDPYRKFNTGTTYTQTPDFYQSSFNQYYYRSLRIGFNYKFGNVSNAFNAKKNVISNDDVKKNTIDIQ